LILALITATTASFNTLSPSIFQTLEALSFAVSQVLIVLLSDLEIESTEEFSSLNVIMKPSIAPSHSSKISTNESL
jgi:hypothetical protein